MDFSTVYKTVAVAAEPILLKLELRDGTDPSLRLYQRRGLPLSEQSKLAVPLRFELRPFPLTAERNTDFARVQLEGHRGIEPTLSEFEAPCLNPIDEQPS